MQDLLDAWATAPALRAAPDDPEMRALAAGLSRDSDTVRDLWSRHDVARPEPAQLFRHPDAGEVTLRRHVLEVAAATAKSSSPTSHRPATRSRPPRCS